jgi:tRNA A-37 threonylcarbamoyl transferase component Bud32
METTCPACGAAVLDIDIVCKACGEELMPEEIRARIGLTVLEHYEITGVLGQGGMSVVYKGRHKLTEQEVALKILPPELAAHSQVKGRFLEEARALAQLDHPHIVHLYNFGQHEGSLILAMQFVHGDTWERLILDRQKLDWQTSCSITLDVLKALELAHGRGVIHRDMKPSNVLVRTDGSALVMDFGIAKMTKSTKLTATGQTMGTVRYMSPEQVRGQEVDARTDLYSLAVTLYESVAGVTPFDGESHFEIMTAHLTQAPPPPSSKGADMPPGLEDVIMAGLAKDPAGRPSSARQMRAMIEEVVAGRAPPRPLSDRSTVDDHDRIAAPPRARVGRGPVFWVGTATAVLAAGALGLFLVLRDPGRASGAGPADGRTGAGQGAAPGGGPVTAPPAAAWPEPHTLAGETFQVDQRFDADRLRVLTSGKRPAAALRAEVVRARRDFAAFLAGHGVSGAVAAQPLNLVVVPAARLCDARLYERGGAPADCADRDYAYRPGEKTLYLADTDGAFEKLFFAVAAGMCLHSDVDGCDAAAVQYARAALGNE